MQARAEAHSSYSARCSPRASSRSASARRCCSSKADAQGSSVQAPMFEVDPLWPQAAAEPLAARLDHRRVGRRAGPRLDHPSRRGGLHNNERGAELNPPIAECCRTAPPVLVFDQAGNLVRSWGGPGQGYEWPQSNHGIHVDYKGNVWIGGNGEKDAHVLKFTKDGKFLMQVGALRQERRQQRPREFRPRRQDLGRSRRPTRPTSPTATEQARRRDRRRHRQDEALLGRLRQQARRHQSRPLRPERAAGAAVPQPGALRRALERRPRLRLRPPATTALQVFRPDGKFVKEAFYARNTLGVGLGLGHRVLEGSRAALHLLADGQNEHVRIIVRETLEEITDVRRRRPPARPVLRRAQHRHRFEGQPLHDRNLRRQARAEVRLQGHRHGPARQPGRALAEAKLNVTT